MKFRASYSVLSIWSSGDYERAIKAYFKLENFITPAMVDGKKWHKTWQKHIVKESTVPPIFSIQKLNNPETELKIVVELAPWLDLVGVIDLYDRPCIWDWKTGKQSSEKYANTMQAPIYGLLATMTKRYVEKAIIGHYDQYTKKSDVSHVWLTDSLLNKAYNWVETLSSEMHHYLTENKLYEQFGGKHENI